MLKLDFNAASSCGYHRMVLPFAFLDAKPSVPVMVFNRYPTSGLTAITQHRKAGYRIVMDLDDFWELDDTHYLRHKFNAPAGNAAKIVASLKLADIVMVTTAQLAIQVAQYSSHVVIVPNALPFDVGQFAPGPRSGASTFVYAGGASHHDDLLVAKHALNNGDVTLAGFESGHAEWQRIGALLPLARRKEVLPLPEYMRAYDGHSVALAPLQPTAFNMCKSNLKVLEAGARNMPLICSNVLPFDNVLDRQYLSLASTESDWAVRMQELRSAPARAADDGQRLGEHVRKHYQLSAANEIRRQVLESFQ